MATKLHPMNGSLTPASKGTTATGGGVGGVAAEDTGMVTATAWTPSEYETYTFPHTTWTAEIRMPIRQTPGYGTEGGGYPTSHGGLLDADPVRQKEWNLLYG